MSLVSTLGKMAVGMLVAKGMGKMMGGGASSGGGLGGLLGSVLGGGQQSSGGLGGMLGSVLGGGRQSGGLGGLLGGLAGSNQQSGGLGDLLGNLASSQRGGAGGLGDLLGNLSSGGQAGGLGDLASMLGGAGSQGNSSLGGILDALGGGSQAGGGLGGLLNEVLQGKTAQPTNDQEKQAEVMLRAMISAAKSDGQIDEEEQEKISQHLDDITQEELDLVRSMMREPLDVDSLVNSVPAGMEQQVYFMSLLAIDLDSQNEANYLHELAQKLNVTQDVANSIHQQLGAPVLYS